MSTVEHGVQFFTNRPGQNPPYIRKIVWLGNNNVAECAARELENIKSFLDNDGNLVSVHHLQQTGM